MDKLIALLKSFSIEFNLTKTGITVFNPKDIDEAKLSELTHPLGLVWRELVPTIMPDGSIKQYYSPKDNCMKDEQHMLIVGLPKFVSDLQMADHLNSLISQAQG